ncbi:hypothetical protein GCM10022204_26650 [Microlunatus aurantiacus]|uniref:PIN domain-containing protein n=1 Tax=Microlunatus aurantiacus TaxID=446786 RepID=A0ABP7DLN6_9ACTN
MFAAVLDTCVLWPSLQRDILVSFAIEGIYRPLWSSAILDELEICETAKLVKRGTPSQDADLNAQNLIKELRRNFDDAEVEGWEKLEGTFGLPDAKDEHVVAAAVVGGAGAIVTSNLKDFPHATSPPPPTLVPRSIQVIPPDEFALNTVSVDPVGSRRAIYEVASRSGRHGSKLTVDMIFDQMERVYKMGDAVAVLKGI